MEGATDYDVLTDFVNTDILTCVSDKKKERAREKKAKTEQWIRAGWPLRAGSPGLAKFLAK